MAALVACGLTLAGCGFGEGPARVGGGAELRVTRDFGRAAIGRAKVGEVRAGQTVMRMLRSNFDVRTRFGGGFVHSIDGLAGEGDEGERDWFYFVNGVEASVGAAQYPVSPGDRVQWDHRDWSAAMRVPAIVGAFPEPLRRGIRGERSPVRVECGDPRRGACGDVKAKLERLGISTSTSTVGAPGGDTVIRVVVAPWRQARLVRAAAALEDGPGASGVFARFSPDGRSLALLDDAGRVARRAGPEAGTGVVAATRGPREEIVWLVTGLDERGTRAAAAALDERRLRDAFAVAATGRAVEKLPLARR